MKQLFTISLLFTFINLFGQNTGVWSLYFSPDSLPIKSADYTDIDYDSLGRMWLTMYNDGIAVRGLDGKWKIKTEINGIKDFSKLIILSDKRVAVAGYDRCFILDYDLNVIRNIATADSTLGEILYMIPDRKGNLIASQYKALVVYGDTLTKVIDNDKFSFGSFLTKSTLYLDNKDTLWVGIYGKIVKIIDNNIIKETYSFGDPSLIFKDKNNIINIIASDWFGNKTILYQRIGVEQLTPVDLAKEGINIQNNWNKYIKTDKNNTVWMTSYPYIISYDGTSWKNWNLTLPPFALEDIHDFTIAANNDVYAVGNEFFSYTRVYRFSPNEIISGVNDISIEPLNSYPNPVHNGILTIDAPETGSITLTDMTGKTILKQTISQTGKQQIQLGTIQDGMYLVQLQCGEKVYTSKIVITQ